MLLSGTSSYLGKIKRKVLEAIWRLRSQRRILMRKGTNIAGADRTEPWYALLHLVVHRITESSELEGTPKESNSEVNGPYRDPTHSLGTISTMLQPPELIPVLVCMVWASSWFLPWWTWGLEEKELVNLSVHISNLTQNIPAPCNLQSCVAEGAWAEATTECSLAHTCNQWFVCWCVSLQLHKAGVHGDGQVPPHYSTYCCNHF